MAGRIRRAYLGIDESSRGWGKHFLYVAVWSQDPEEVMPINGGFSKNGRDRHNISEILRGNDFRYILVPHETPACFVNGEARLG